MSTPETSAVTNTKYYNTLAWTEYSGKLLDWSVEKITCKNEGNPLMAVVGLVTAAASIVLGLVEIVAKGVINPILWSADKVCVLIWGAPKEEPEAQKADAKNATAKAKEKLVEFYEKANEVVEQTNDKINQVANSATENPTRTAAIGFGAMATPKVLGYGASLVSGVSTYVAPHVPAFIGTAGEYLAAAVTGLVSAMPVVGAAGLVGIAGKMAYDRYNAQPVNADQTVKA